jgi:TRAP-type C4-dicarboxylate transport system permease small subunit
MQSKTMNLWVRGIAMASRVSGVFSAGLMLLSVLVVCHMVFVRAVLGQSSIWQTEFVTFSLIAATFLGSPYILLTRGHVNVDLLPLVLGHAARKPLALLASGLALVFCVLFFYSSLHWWWEAWTLNLTTPSLWRARLWIPYLSVPVGLGLLCLQYLVDVWALLTDRDMPFGMSPDGAAQAQEGQS